MAFMVRHIRKLSRGRVVAQKAMIPGSAACKVTQAGNLTEKWQFSIFFQGHITDEAFQITYAYGFI